MRWLVPILFGAASTWFGIASSADKPRSCHANDTLKPSEHGVVAHDGRFTQRGGSDFPYRTLSIAEKADKADPKNPHMCFRYQMENTGKERIEWFTWPDIDHWYSDLDPGRPVPKLRQEATDFDYSAVKEKSVVRAFGKVEDRTRALFTVEKAVEDKKSGSVSAAKPFGFFSYDTQMPHVVPALKAHKLEVSRIPAYSQPKENRPFPQLRTSLESGDLRLEVVSDAVFDGGTVLIKTIVTVSDADARVFAPALAALEKTFRAPLDAKDVTDFAEALPSETAGALLLSRRSHVRELSFRPSSDTGLPALFVLKHPVTVVTPSGSFCTGVSSYSPIPADVGGDYCNWKQLRR